MVVVVLVGDIVGMGVFWQRGMWLQWERVRVGGFQVLYGHLFIPFFHLVLFGYFLTFSCVEFYNVL